MKVYKVEGSGYGFSFFDIICADSDEEALEIARNEHDCTNPDIEDLTAEELEDVSCNTDGGYLITGTYLD